MKISIIGKSTVPPSDPAYQLIQDITRFVLGQGHTVIHGGYAGGIMQAVADSAYTYLLQNNLPLSRNIGVPEKRFDNDWPRVEHAYFTEPSNDIFDRLRSVVGESDVVIVSSRGGDGTMLELQVILHENMLCKYTKKEPTKVVILQTSFEGSVNWKKIVETQLLLLDNSISSIDDIEKLEWLYFCDEENYEKVLTL